MNFLILEKYPEINIEYLNYLEDNGHKIFGFQEQVDFSQIDAIIIRSKIELNKDLISKFPNLKYVCRIGVGLEKVDLKLCDAKNIKVLNTPGANSSSVADLVIWGILSLLRKTNKSWRNLDDRFQFFGENLENKKIGFIGFGNIAKKVYSRLSGFEGNDFVFFDPYISSDIGNVKKMQDKKEIFKTCDIISFHIPLTEETKNFLGKDDFSLLKKNVKIINTSRGGIIDENELIRFLQKNKESGAFLDTWEEEPVNPKTKLLNLENCIITPHIGAMTLESDKNMHYFKEFDINK
ncbi:MAG: NAD(P)-dependent oxidoreductase [Candidatus Gracilibacteria bacterium]|nr:NAD(P)-dependent oxidoreductase [Candidatus Gracilibacteria bacterium]